jgi:hypothetical protein
MYWGWPTSWWEWGWNMTAVIRAIVGWLVGGSAFATLVSAGLAVCALVLGLVYRRYLGLLGADRRRPAERQAYDALRDSLAHGVNAAARIYAERLTAFLDHSTASGPHDYRIETRLRVSHTEPTELRDTSAGGPCTSIRGPCHYSTYDPKEDAKVVSGPAPRRLPALPLKLRARGQHRQGFFTLSKRKGLPHLSGSIPLRLHATCAFVLND